MSSVCPASWLNGWCLSVLLGKTLNIGQSIQLSSPIFSYLACSSASLTSANKPLSVASILAESHHKVKTCWLCFVTHFSTDQHEQYLMKQFNLHTDLEWEFVINGNTFSLLLLQGSQVSLWGSTFSLKFFSMWPFFNPTIEVVIFHLRGQ